MTLTLVNGFPLEFEWQLVSSSLQDSSEYSSRFQCWSLDVWEMYSIQKICLALSLLSPKNLAVTVRLGEGIEKCIKK